MKKQLFLYSILLFVAVGVKAQNHWVPNPHQFPSNMNVIAIVEINGVEQQNEYLELGAFCEEECRGSKLLRYYDPPADRYLLFLTIYGEGGDQLYFKLYDHLTQHELECTTTDTLYYSSNAIIGLPSNPHVFPFEGGQCNLEVVSTPDNAGTVEGGGSFPCGTYCTLTATPFPGSTFEGWLLEGDTLSTETEYAFNVLWDMEVTAMFERHPFTITADCEAGAGKVEGGGVYYYGEQCTLSFTPEQYYSFVEWREDEEWVSSDNPYTFVVDSDRNLKVVASFYDAVKETAYTPRFYPNPSSGWVHVDYGEDASLEGMELVVYDLEGRRVLVTDANPFDASSLPSGAYILKVGGSYAKLILLR